MKVYRGIGPEEGTIVTEEEAFDYALERCLKGTEEDQEEFRKELKPKRERGRKRVSKSA